MPEQRWVGIASYCGNEEPHDGVWYGRYYLGIHGEGTVSTSNTDLAQSLRERVRVVIENVRFERAITTLIVANSITLGLVKAEDCLHSFRAAIK